MSEKNWRGGGFDSHCIPGHAGSDCACLLVMYVQVCQCQLAFDTHHLMVMRTASFTITLTQVNLVAETNGILCTLNRCKNRCSNAVVCQQ